MKRTDLESRLMALGSKINALLVAEGEDWMVLGEFVLGYSVGIMMEHGASETETREAFDGMLRDMLAARAALTATRGQA